MWQCQQDFLQYQIISQVWENSRIADNINHFAATTDSTEGSPSYNYTTCSNWTTSYNCSCCSSCNSRNIRGCNFSCSSCCNSSCRSCRSSTCEVFCERWFWSVGSDVWSESMDSDGVVGGTSWSANLGKASSTWHDTSNVSHGQLKSWTWLWKRPVSWNLLFSAPQYPIHRSAIEISCIHKRTLCSVGSWVQNQGTSLQPPCEAQSGGNPVRPCARCKEGLTKPFFNCWQTAQASRSMAWDIIPLCLQSFKAWRLQGC